MPEIMRAGSSRASQVLSISAAFPPKMLPIHLMDLRIDNGWVAQLLGGGKDSLRTKRGRGERNTGTKIQGQNSFSASSECHDEKCCPLLADHRVH